MSSSTKSNSNTNYNQQQTPIVPPYAASALGNLTATTEGLATQNPQSFVAPLQPDQLAAISQGGLSSNAGGLTGTNSNFGAASSALAGNNPSGFGQGSALLQSNANVGPSQINEFMSPYTTGVIGSENQLLNQQFGQQNAAMQANAAATGAFGGDRYGVAQGVLGGQQALDLGNIDANLLNTGWTNAVQAAIQNAGLGQSAGVSLGNIGAQQGQLGVANAQALGNIGAQQSASNVANTAELANLGATQQATAQAQATAPIALDQAVAALLSQNQYGLLTGQNLTGQQSTSGSTTSNPGLAGILGALGGLATGAGNLGALFAPQGGGGLLAT